MSFVRALVIALVVKVITLALIFGIPYGLFIASAGARTQSALLRLMVGLVFVAPVVGGALAARSVWKRAERARGMLALAAGVITAAVIAVPVPGVPWSSVLNLVAPDFVYTLYEGPRGCTGYYSCGTGMRCARKGPSRQSRDYQCIGPVESSCFAPSDCPSGTRCSCLCPPPPSQDRPGGCALECVPDALAGSLPPLTGCDLDPRPDQPPSLESPGELLLTYPPLAGPPRPVRLLCAWSYNQGFVSVDAWKRSDGRTAIPLSAKTLPLDVLDGRLFVVEGHFRLLHNSSLGFTLADQVVRRATAGEEQLVADIGVQPGGPSFLRGAQPESGDDSPLFVKVLVDAARKGASTAQVSVVLVNRRDTPVTLERIAVNGSIVADRGALFDVPARSMGRWRGEVSLETSSKRALHFDIATSGGIFSPDAVAIELAD